MRAPVAAVAAVVLVALALIVATIVPKAGDPQPEAPTLLSRVAANVGVNEEEFAAPSLPMAAPGFALLPPGSEAYEVCGLGFVDRAEIERPDFEARHWPRLAEKRERWHAAMAASADDSVRAAGRYIIYTAKLQEVSSPLVDRQLACGDDARCIAEAGLVMKQAVDRETRANVEAIVAAATSTHDPLTYAAAVTVCGAPNGLGYRGGSCQLITAERWAQLDPDNAVPWLSVAARAALRQDNVARDEALYRASLARTSRIEGQSLLTHVEASLPADLSDMERLQLLYETIGAAASWPLPDFQVTTGYCSADAVRDANVRQVCDALATTFVDRSQTLIERFLGTRIGERAGWPAERIASLQRERDAFAEVASGGPETSMDCASISKQLRRMSSQARLGELEYWQRAIESSPESMETLANRQRDKRRLQAEDLAKTRRAAASAPAAAPP